MARSARWPPSSTVRAPAAAKRSRSARKRRRSPARRRGRSRSPTTCTSIPASTPGARAAPTARIGCCRRRTVGCARSSARRVSGRVSSNCAARPNCSPSPNGRTRASGSRMSMSCGWSRRRASPIARAKSCSRRRARSGTTMGVLHTPSEFVAHAQTKSRGFFAATGFEGLGDAPFAIAPCKLSATPASVRRAAPTPHDGDAVSDGSRGPLLDHRRTPCRHRPMVCCSPGVRVVEFGMAAVVPEAYGVLSELGADVIKVESTTHPDVLRLGEHRRQQELHVQRGEPRPRERRDRSLDALADASSRGNCVRSADIVAENYRGGVLDRLGLGYDDIRAVNPAVVYVSSQGYGRGGPYGEMPAFGPLNAGFAGLHHLWSDPDTPYPCGTSLNHPDHIAGKLLAVAVLAAWDHRQRTGEGQHLDMAQTEAAAYPDRRGLPRRRAHRRRARCQTAIAVDDAVPHGVYPQRRRRHVDRDRGARRRERGTRSRTVVGWPATSRGRRSPGASPPATRSTNS